MIIEFERKGGFAGIRISTVIDTNELSAEDSEKVHSMVQTSDFFNLPTKVDVSKIKGAADYFNYKISIKKNDTKHYIERTDLTMDNRVTYI